MSNSQKFLDELNHSFLKLHKNYEELFWTLYMGDKSVGPKKDEALKAFDAFRSNKSLHDQAVTLQTKSTPALKKRLQIWIDFFDQYQMSDSAKEIKAQIASLETQIEKKRSSRTEGYIDPHTKKFTSASSIEMRTMTRTNPDEKIRKACYQAREEMALDCLEEYVSLVKLRNTFANEMGYEDFYDYKLRSNDKMTKDELFGLFEDISKKATGHFDKIRDLEKEKPGLRHQWNLSYMMAGDFTKEEDQYFQFDQALFRWGRSYSALGIDFKGGKLKLDLLDRKGKWNNGFCHWPDLVHFEKGKRVAGSSNFTCNVVAGQIGSGVVGLNTLFHEGGHAAHFLNVEQKEVCLNHEYAPMSVAWAETQSMFIDTLFDSIEWRQRYAKNEAGENYPFELFARKEQKLSIFKPSHMLSIIFVCTFEKEVYELKNPTSEKILKIAKKNNRKFFDMREDSLFALNIPHIYAWESSCAYHGYGLAEIALSQWREYFYKKYGYIVDNPKIGKEMKTTWQWGASLNFNESIKKATGKKLSSSAFIKVMTMSPEKTIKQAKLRLERMKSVKEYTKAVNLKADIKMVHGDEVIADNKKSFDLMAQKYSKWVKKMATKK